MSALPKRKYTIEEYIELYKNSEERFEYFDGEIFSMAGGKIDHSEIGANVLHQLRNQLAGRPCRVYGPDAAVKVPTAPPFRLPDVSVVCGQRITESVQGIDALVNPLLIVEVLSETTEAYDLNKKFVAYQSIDSFQEYLVIAQKYAHVILHTKQGNGFWLRRDVMGLDSEVHLETLNVTLTLREIYENVQFPATEEQ